MMVENKLAEFNKKVGSSKQIFLLLKIKDGD